MPTFFFKKRFCKSCGKYLGYTKNGEYKAVRDTCEDSNGDCFCTDCAPSEAVSAA